MQITHERIGLGSICGDISKLIMIDTLPINAHVTNPNYLVDE